MKVMIIPIVICAHSTILKCFVNGARIFKNLKMSGDHPDYCIINISQNSEESSGNLSERPSACSGEKNSHDNYDNNFKIQTDNLRANLVLRIK